MPNDGFWVFAYGSLIWNPGFAAEERAPATLFGYRRSFCLASIVYRGTPEDPGLVLALDKEREAQCAGIAYRVGAEGATATLDYLRDRELVSSAYLEVTKTVRLTDGRAVPAMCYVMDPEHHQYRGGLSLEEQAAIIARSSGPAGSNRDYLNNTVHGLAQLGLRDETLEWLAERVRHIP